MADGRPKGGRQGVYHAPFDDQIVGTSQEDLPLWRGRRVSFNGPKTIAMEHVLHMGTRKGNRQGVMSRARARQGGGDV